MNGKVIGVKKSSCDLTFFVETLHATKKKEGDCLPFPIFFVTIYEIADNTQNLFPSFYAALHFWVNFHSVYEKWKPTAEIFL